MNRPQNFKSRTFRTLVCCPKPNHSHQVCSSLYLTSYMKINTHSPVGISSLHKTVRKKLCLDDWLLDDTSLWLELSTQFLLLSNILASENVKYIKMDLPRKWLLISLSNIADKYVLLQDGMNYRFSTIFL